MPFLDIRVALFLLMATAGFAEPIAPAEGATTSNVADVALSDFDAASWDVTAIGAVDHDVFSLALSSAERAVERGDAKPSTLTVIDFSVPSTERRMFVYDLRSRALLFEE